jgi:hypothetical protein
MAHTHRYADFEIEVQDGGIHVARSAELCLTVDAPGKIRHRKALAPFMSERLQQQLDKPKLRSLLYGQLDGVHVYITPIMVEGSLRWSVVMSKQKLGP